LKKVEKQIKRKRDGFLFYLRLFSGALFLKKLNELRLIQFCHFAEVTEVYFHSSVKASLLHTETPLLVEN